MAATKYRQASRRFSLAAGAAPFREVGGSSLLPLSFGGEEWGEGVEWRAEMILGIRPAGPENNPAKNPANNPENKPANNPEKNRENNPRGEGGLHPLAAVRGTRVVAKEGGTCSTQRW